MRNTYSPLMALSAAFASRAYAATNITGLSDDALRNGDVGFDSIPTIVQNVTNYLLGIVGTVCVVAVIYGSVRMGFGSLSHDKETGKKIITAALVGFVVSLSGWFLVNLVISNL